jgi:hypothetical protein
VATAWYQPREVMLGSEQHSSGGMADLEDRLTAQALADGDPAGWFERFYRAAAAGEVELPWDRAEPHRLPAISCWPSDAIATLPCVLAPGHG